MLKTQRWLFLCLLISACVQNPKTPNSMASEGLYRLPYANGTEVYVFDDFKTHGPPGQLDLVAATPRAPYLVVAAAPGRVMAIEDGFSEQQSGRPAAECRNNFVWIAHANGEWTGYSHMRQHSVRDAGIRVGDWVNAGDTIGVEGTVGCSMLDHVHIEVAIPDGGNPVNAGGFLLDNEGGHRFRDPRLCGVEGQHARQNARYVAKPCPAQGNKN